MRSTIPIIIMASGLLAGCVANPPPRPHLELPPIPADIRACVARYMPRPPGPAPLNEQQTYLLIAKLKASDEAKSGCLARLIALYEAQAEIVREALK